MLVGPDAREHSPPVTNHPGEVWGHLRQLPSSPGGGGVFISLPPLSLPLSLSRAWMNLKKEHYTE